MSIQVTIELTREEAEDRMVSKILKREEEDTRSAVVSLGDEEIEDFIEDEFYNYSIKKK